MYSNTSSPKDLLLLKGIEEHRLLRQPYGPGLYAARFNASPHTRDRTGIQYMEWSVVLQPHMVGTASGMRPSISSPFGEFVFPVIDVQQDRYRLDLAQVDTSMGLPYVLDSIEKSARNYGEIMEPRLLTWLLGKTMMTDLTVSPQLIGYNGLTAVTTDAYRDLAHKLVGWDISPFPIRPRPRTANRVTGTPLKTKQGLGPFDDEYFGQKSSGSALEPGNKSVEPPTTGPYREDRSEAPDTFGGSCKTVGPLGAFFIGRDGAKVSTPYAAEVIQEGWQEEMSNNPNACGDDIPPLVSGTPLEYQ